MELSKQSINRSRTDLARRPAEIDQSLAINLFVLMIIYAITKKADYSSLGFNQSEALPGISNITKFIWILIHMTFIK